MNAKASKPLAVARKRSGAASSTACAPGRSLRPREWPDGARCAVALSFDSDHETNELREGGESIGKLSQGQYGNRQGVPRILDILAPPRREGELLRARGHGAALSRTSSGASSREGHEIGIHGWIHERNSLLPPRGRARPADALGRRAGEDLRRAPRGHPHAVVGLQPEHARDHARDGPPLRLVADGRRRLLRAPAWTARTPAWSSCRSSGFATTRSTSS